MGNMPSWIVTHGDPNSVPLFIAALTQYRFLFIFTIQFTNASH